MAVPGNFKNLEIFYTGRLSVTVPDGYEVIATERLKSRIVQADSVQFAYEGSLAVNNFNCSIAPYKKVTTTVGTFFLLNDCLNIDVEDIMKKAHEFIHLGWNAKAEGIVQRMRFFDEAFTCYFQMRVMEVLTGDNDLVHYYINSYRQQMNSGKYELVPISEFGKYEYGDLNFSEYNFS